MKARELLAYLSFLFEGDWDRIYNAVKTKYKVEQEDVDKFVKENKNDYITIIDDDYPKSLKSIGKPPFVLFYKGDISLIKDENFNNCLSVVGSRDCTKYGKNSVKELIEGINENLTIVSGLAKGIDKIAHEAALNSGKKTVAVLGCGINEVYPEENRSLYNRIVESGSLIISEYPNNKKAEKENFLVRNRLVSAFGKALLVGEAYKRSGTSVTVSHMLALGKDVGCIPYPINLDSSCNQLIKDGAFLIENPEDIMTMLNCKV